jgi:alkylated DNA nucleotide flippase Atl1
LTDAGFEEQRLLLLAEGIAVGSDGSVDLGRFGWPEA